MLSAPGCATRNMRHTSHKTDHVWKTANRNHRDVTSQTNDVHNCREFTFHPSITSPADDLVTQTPSTYINIVYHIIVWYGILEFNVPLDTV